MYLARWLPRVKPTIDFIPLHTSYDHPSTGSSTSQKPSLREGGCGPTLFPRETFNSDVFFSAHLTATYELPRTTTTSSDEPPATTQTTSTSSDEPPATTPILASMEVQTEIDTAVWPMVEDFSTFLAPHSTDLDVPNQPGQKVPVVDLTAIRDKYGVWRLQYEESLARGDEIRFERDRLALELADAQAKANQTPSDRETALEAEIVTLKTDLAAKETLPQPADADGARWQREYKKQRLLVKKWRERYDTVQELARRLPSYPQQAQAPVNAVQPQSIIIQAPPRQSKDHLVDHKPVLLTGAKDFETVATFLGQVEHYVEQGGGAFPDRLTDPDGRSFELSRDDKLVDTFWRYVNREVLDWFKRATNIARLPPHQHSYRLSWDQPCTLFKDYYVPKIAKSVIRTQWRELKFTKNDMTGFNKRAYELVKLLGGSLELDRESDSGLFEDYWLKLPDVAKNEIAQLERMWGAVNKKVTLGDAMNLTNERYLRMGSSGSTYLSTSDTSAAGPPAQQQVAFQTGAPVATYPAPPHAPPAPPAPAAQPYYGPEPMDLNAIDGKCFRCAKYGHKASECEQPDFRDRSHNWRSSRGDANYRSRGNGQGSRGGYNNNRGGDNRASTGMRGGNRRGRSGYRVYAIESGDAEDDGEMQWPVEELEEGVEDVGGGGYAETVTSGAAGTSSRSPSGNAPQ
jgi:hypothetical protein